MKYTGKYFKNDMPEWKRVKDPLTSRIFYRRISFYISAFLANRGVMANTVSYFSIILAVFSGICMLIPNYVCNIIGAVFVNLWLISDCVDGNLARTVKKQPYGTFADSISSYILVAIICSAMGFSCYFSGGLLIQKGNIWIAVLGTYASIGDTLMRLIYKKFKASERELADQGKITVSYDKRIDEKQTNSLLVRIESDFGIGGILPLLILIGTILKWLDIVIIYSFVYYFFSCVVMSSKYIFKAIKQTKELESRK